MKIIKIIYGNLVIIKAIGGRAIIVFMRCDCSDITLRETFDSLGLNEKLLLCFMVIHYDKLKEMLNEFK